MNTSERILMQLKMRGPQTAEALAAQLDLTSKGVRRHLESAFEKGLVGYEDSGQGRAPGATLGLEPGRASTLSGSSCRAHGRLDWAGADAVCAAARMCQDFCRSELDVFVRVLGPTVKVVRIEYQLHGARRCAYAVSKAE